MKKIDLGQTITILANVGVIGGLIFVGIQLQQDRLIARTVAVQDAVSGRIAFAESLGADAETWVRGLANERLTAIEQAQFDALAAAHELYYFNNWFRNESIGTEIAEQRWIREMALDAYTHTGLMDWWRRHVERQSRTTPGAPSTWITAVNDEIERLQARSE